MGSGQGGVCRIPIGDEGEAVKLTGRRCLCRACGEHFNSVAGFDRHRTGSYDPLTRRCLDYGQLMRKGFSKNAAGFWITERMPGSTIRRADSSRFKAGPMLGRRVGVEGLESSHAEVGP